MRLIAVALARETGRPAKVARRVPQHEGDQEEDEPCAGKQSGEEEEEEDERMPAEGAVRVSLAGGVGSKPRVKAAGARHGRGTIEAGARSQEATCAPGHLQALSNSFVYEQLPVCCICCYKRGVTGIWQTCCWAKRSLSDVYLHDICVM